MIPVPLVALINACLIDMALKIELRIEHMLRILCSDLTATSDPFKNTDRWIIASFLWGKITCMACLLLNCIFHWYIKNLFKLLAAISTS